MVELAELLQEFLVSVTALLVVLASWPALQSFMSYPYALVEMYS